MLGAIKLPSSGVSLKKFYDGRRPMLRLSDATVGVFVCHSRHNGTEIFKVRVFMLIEHYDMLQETCTCGLKNSAVRSRKPEYAKRTRLVVFVYAGTSANASQPINCQHQSVYRCQSSFIHTVADV